MKKIAIVTLMMLCSMTMMAKITAYVWKGTLGTEIKFQLDVKENSFGALIGQTTYFRKNGKVARIKCYGYRSVDSDGNVYFLLDEFNGTKECGHFCIEMTMGKFQFGSWSYGNKTLGMDLTEFPEPGKADIAFDPVTTAKDAVGEYSFSYESNIEGMDDNGGTCLIKLAGDNRIKWSMCQVTPNIAEAEGEAEYGNGIFSGKHEEYTFDAYVDKDFIYVKKTCSAEVRESDFWGMGATIAGIYVKKVKK